MRTLGLVPARGGSKGIPRKNFRDFCGKPLMRWAVDVAKETCDLAMVSSDDTEAQHLASLSEVGFLYAPEPLHTDDCAMIDVVKDALGASPGIDVIVLLQPTSPLRTAQHVRDALKMLEETGADCVFSVTPVPEEYSPEWMVPLNLLPGAHMDAMPKRRQDLKRYFIRDGTVYASRARAIREGSLYGNACRPMFVPPEESVNINTWDDWHRAEQMMRERNGQRQAG